MKYTPKFIYELKQRLKADLSDHNVPNNFKRIICSIVGQKSLKTTDLRQCVEDRGVAREGGPDFESQ